MMGYSFCIQKIRVRKIPWRRKQVPTLVLWPGEFHGLYSPSSRKESDTIEPLSLSGTRVEEGRREANTRCHVIQLITASKPSLFLRETISRYCILQQPKDSSGEEIFVCKLFLICHLILVQICPMAHATLELLRITKVGNRVEDTLEITILLTE